MDKKIFKERLERLEEMAPVLSKLPPEVRMAAFNMLAEAKVDSPSGKTSRSATQESQVEIDSSSAEEFFATYNHDKPADNVKLIVAYFYNQYGSETFSTKEIKDQANGVGITIPNRPDVTLLGATQEGKKLFNQIGKGKFKPTVHGEAYLKATYNVKKGTQKRQVASSNDAG